MNSSSLKPFLLLIVLVPIVHGYIQINDHKEAMAFYEQYSYMPIMHVYFNKHFSNSKQFQSFLDTLQDAQTQVGPYSKIILTNCQVTKKQEHKACAQIQRQNENRMIVGFAPSSTMTKFGDKVMQSPPTNRIFDHFSDTYTVEQLARFIKRMVPNFFRQINNIHDFQQFKQPRYAPKLIFVSEDGQVPEVVRQIGVSFFLRFDMGYVQDLTESVINHLEIKTLPTLVVLRHNYQTDDLEVVYYQGINFSEENFNQISAFLQDLALPQPRNDHMFHLIRAPKESSIQTVQSQAQLNYDLDTAQGWVFIQQGPFFDQLSELRQKYDRYYSYIHHLKPQGPNRVILYNPRSQEKYPYSQGSVKYNLMSPEDFKSNSTVWLKKDYVVMAVRQQYGYLCTIIDKPLFSGITQCFVIDETGQKEVAQSMGIEFTYGFIASSEKSGKKVQGNQIKTTQFDSVYRLLEYATRIKVKDLIDNFLQDPVKHITEKISIQELCAQPFKKCIFYFFTAGKDSTKREYLEMEAIHFVNQYKIYKVDLSCNSHLYEEIPQLEGKNDGLMAFHPRSNNYVYLKAKMTRPVIQKFLRINNQEKKALPFKTFASQQVFVNPCIQDSDNASEQL